MPNLLFTCPACAAPLRQTQRSFGCAHCRTEYPVRAGVPILLDGMSIRPSGISLSDADLARLMPAAALPENAETRAAAREIFAWNYHLADLALDAENNYYFERVGLSVRAQRQAAPPGGAAPVRYRIAHHHFPPSLPCARTMSWNCRIVNEGESALAASGPSAIRVASRWRDISGKVAHQAADATELPIDLLPGRAISVPVWIETPTKPGRYQIELALQRRSEWIGDNALSLPVKLVRSWNGCAPRSWRRLDKPQESYSYAEDHEIGRDFVRREVSRRGLKSPLMLEVGGCCSPMLWDFPGEVHSCDIDVQTVQLGALRFAKSHPHLHFFAGDANRLPFASGVFDFAVMFATLHHLVDPARCLAELRRVVKPAGFIALSSEPIGSYRAATVTADFIRELEQGINEQIFTAEEYVQMFRRAGLRADRVEIDRGSLRAILRRFSFVDRVAEIAQSTKQRVKSFAKQILPHPARN